MLFTHGFGPVLTGPPSRRDRPIAHLLAEQDERERAQQTAARVSARRALSAVAGRRVAEVNAALAVRASALRRAA